MASVTETSFSPTSFHFFTIILQQTLQNNKLQIPKKIVRKCGSALADQVFLKLPCGSKWELGLTKSSDGKVWIDKGWPEFSKQYFIERGHLLIFRYEGNSQFSVVIFDTSTAEIDYPFEKHVETERQNQVKFVKEKTGDGNEDDNSVENLKSPFSRPCPKARDKSRFPSSRPHKRMRSDPVNGKFALSAKGGGDGGENSIAPWRLSAKEKAQALERASGFKSSHPFFMVVMQPSHVRTMYYLNVPWHFAKSYLDTSKQVILKTPDRRTWSVKYDFKGFAHIKSSKPRFETGWKAFAQDNDLKRGDVCVFVMTKNVGSSVLFEVSFFRERGIANSASEPVHKAAGLELGQRTSPSTKVKSGNTIHKKSLAVNGKSEALEIASSFESKNPFFTIVMQASYTRDHFSIPSEFARTYIENQGDISLCVSDGRYWSVQYKIRSKTSGLRAFQLCHGWFTFVRESGLQEGDICTFELTNRDEISFLVHIAKDVGREAYKQTPLALGPKRARLVGPERNASARTSPRLLMKPTAKEALEKATVETAGKFGTAKTEENNAAGRVSQIRKAYEAANKFCSKHPYFQVDFPSSHLDKYSLVLPSSFAISYLEGKTQTATLQVGEKSWPVTILYGNSGIGIYRFSRGWSVFVMENSLRPSDVCIFELIERNEAVLKVSIFRESHSESKEIECDNESL